MVGLVQCYAVRPVSLDDMCLADFTVEYDVSYHKKLRSKYDSCSPITEDDPQYDKIIKLQNGMGLMRHRKTRAILLTHRFSADKEPEKHYHSELMLYVPWRDEESDLLCGMSTYSDAYASKCDQVETAKQKFQHYADDLTGAIDQFFDNGPPESAWDAWRLKSAKKTSSVQRRE